MPLLTELCGLAEELPSFLELTPKVSQIPPPLLISRPLNAQLLHATAEGTWIKVEDFRRAALAFNHPVGLRQHRLDVTAFDFVQGGALIRRCRRRGHEALLGFRI